MVQLADYDTVLVIERRKIRRQEAKAPSRRRSVPGQFLGVRKHDEDPQIQTVPAAAARTDRSAVRAGGSLEQSRGLLVAGRGLSRPPVPVAEALSFWIDSLVSSQHSTKHDRGPRKVHETG